MRQAAVIGLAFVVASGMPALAAKANALTCTGVMREFPLNLPGFRVSFERPLTITPDLSGGEDLDVHILSTDAEVDGTLKCRADTFARFEVRIGTPADQQVLDNFQQFQEAALATVFRWDKARTATVARAMSSDADEYLRASIERGDIYHAGKVEYHEGRGIDFGAIWTESDRTLVIFSQTND